MKTLGEKIKELPPELQQEVGDFVEFLLEKRAKKKGKFLRQDWAGALSEYREQYTALELQKKALEWRGDCPGSKEVKTLEEKIKELPPELQQEVGDFVEFLLEKRKPKAELKPKGKFKFDWAGALKDMRDEYTSVELQHKIRDWWGD